MWKGKLQRRIFKDMKACIKCQAMLRGWMVRHEYTKALKQARKLHDVQDVEAEKTESSELEGLLSNIGGAFGDSSQCCCCQALHLSYH